MDDAPLLPLELLGWHVARHLETADCAQMAQVCRRLWRDYQLATVSITLPRFFDVPKGQATLLNARLAGYVNLQTLAVPCGALVTGATLCTLRRLTTLRLAQSRMIMSAAVASLTSLTHLELVRCLHLTDAAIQALPRLTHLVLSGSARHPAVPTNPTTGRSDFHGTELSNPTGAMFGFTDAGLGALANLTHLSLNGDFPHITDAGVRSLAPTLCVLQLGADTRITGRGVSALTRLVTLRLVNFQLTGMSPGMYAPLTQLRWLDVFGCLLSDEATVGLGQLELLRIAPMTVSTQGLMNMTRLERLVLRDDMAVHPRINAYIKCLPKLTIGVIDKVYCRGMSEGHYFNLAGLRELTDGVN